MSARQITGCFYLDSCIILSEILGENETRLAKLKKDVERHNIDCYFSESVEKECENKIQKTVNFLDFVLRKVIIAYLEGILLKPRDLSKSKITNEDLFIIQEAFMTVNRTARDFDLISDPFQAIEEWVVEKLEGRNGKERTRNVKRFCKVINSNCFKSNY